MSEIVIDILIIILVLLLEAIEVAAASKTVCCIGGMFTGVSIVSIIASSFGSCQARYVVYLWNLC